MITPVTSSAAPKNLDFSLLKHNPSGISGSNLGGRFALPVEFDATKFASAFVPKGQEVLVRQQDEPILGSDRIAPGWSVWKYPGNPVTKELPESSSKSTKKEKKNRGVLELRVGQEHPMAGQAHEIPGTKPGETFVLMFRPLEVQRQVNAMYGHLSREAMVNETLGNTLNHEIAGSGGMLPKPLLDREAVDVQADREFEESGFGRSTTVDCADAVPSGPRIRKRETVVHQ